MDSLSGFSELPANEPKKWDLEDSKSEARHLRWGRTIVTLIMTILVVIMNCAVIFLIYKVALAELKLPPGTDGVYPTRIIDGKIYLSLIGGTVAEVTALFFIILRYTFNKQDEIDSETKSSSV